MKYFRILFGLVCFCFGSSAMATDYYVNPTGNDLWSGTLNLPNAVQTDGPFKTLERAKLAIRTLKTTNQFTDKVTVTIASGRYYLNQALNFTLLDSGLPGKEILWQGEPGAQVTISGGLPITCTKRNATFWDCPVTTLPVSTAYYDTGRIKGNGPKFELFVNDQKLELARWPDKDWAHIKIPVDTKSHFSVIEKLPAFTGNIQNAQVHIFNNAWFDEYIGLFSVDSLSNTIGLATPIANSLERGRQFYIQNILSELNAPSEWFYDSTTKIVTFIPPVGTTPQQVILSSLPQVLKLNGVGYLSFKNLTLQHSVNDAIASISSNNIILDHLVINNVSGRGINIYNGTNCMISNNEIHHTGGGAATIDGGVRATLISSGNSFYNNNVHDTNSTLLATPSVIVGGVGATVARNLIGQGPNIGIMIYGNNHVIEKNELHDLCLQSADCSAVYSGGDWTARGNIIRYNYIHDIMGYGKESYDDINNTVIFSSPNDARGIYIDEAASGFEIASNIIENPGSFAIHVNGGRDNNMHNNYISTSKFAILISNRELYNNWTSIRSKRAAMPYLSPIWINAYPQLAAPMNHETWPEGNSISRNIFVSTNPTVGTELFRYDIPTASTTITDNIIWSNSGSIKVAFTLLGMTPYKSSTWADWIGAGVERNSIYADPCVTIANKQMTTCSPALLSGKGFTLISTDIGLIPDASVLHQPTMMRFIP